MTQKEIERTEIEAPYELPEGWTWCRLGDVIETSKEKTDTFSSEMKYVGLEHIDSNGKINGWTSAGDVKSLKNIFHANQILYGKLRPYLNKHDIADFTGVCSTDILVFNAKTDCSNKYINYFFNLPYFIDFAVSNSKGINLPRVSERIILEIPFPLPPTLAEQQRIVNRIETMFAKLDQAQEKAQAVLDSFETRKAAILHKAFTGELTANWRKENGVSDESWEEKTIGNCGSVYGGGTPSTSHKEYWENGNILWITSKDMKSDLIEDSEMHVNMKGIDNSSAKYIDKPAVLFVMRSGILRRTFPVCMIKKEFTVNQDLKALVPNDSIILEYLFYVCKSNERKILDTCMKSGTTVESINSDSLFNFMIKIPSLPEQQEIVRILDTVLEKESRAKEAAQTVLDQIALLKKSILVRAFRGEL